MTQAFKVELLIIDHEGIGKAEVQVLLENQKHLFPHVKAIKSVDLGEWTDDHPLNHKATIDAEYERLFPSQWDEDEHERVAQQHYELGLLVALEDLGKEFHRRSGEAYARDQYDQARELKALGKEFTERGEKARAAYKKKKAI
jgi:hypothetical protein